MSGVQKGTQGVFPLWERSDGSMPNPDALFVSEAPRVKGAWGIEGPHAVQRGIQGVFPL